MKKLLLLLFIPFIVSCDKYSQTKKAMEDQALASGIYVDTIFKGFTFHDSPDTYKSKLDSLCRLECRTWPGKYTYRFKYPGSLSELEWSIDGIYTHFYNDTLYRFSIVTEAREFLWFSRNGYFAQLDTLFSRKYGEPLKNELAHEYHWYKGNLEIEIAGWLGSEKGYKDEIRITYTNLLMTKHWLERWKMIDSFEHPLKVNCDYSKDYWMKTYDKQVQKVINEGVKDL